MSEVLTNEQLEQQKQINEAFKSCVRRESLDNLKARQANYRNDIQNYTENLKNAVLRLKDVEIAIEAYDKQEPVDFYSKLKEVTLNNKIESFDVNIARHLLIAITKPLIMTASNGGRYRLGQMRIEFNVKTCRVRFYCVDENERRRSYWGDRCNHPHVSDSGEGCLGNSAESIAYLSSEFEFGALFDIFVAYLESINLDDGAGRYAMNWDTVDEQGNVIHEGFKNLSSSDFDYGSHFKDDKRPEVTKCDHCGRWHRTDGSITAPDGKQFCRDCAYDLLKRCQICKVWHYKDNVRIIDGTRICTECKAKQDAEREAEQKAKEAEMAIAPATPVNPVPVEDGEVCASCGSTITGDKYWNEEGNVICEDCFGSLI